MCTHEPQCPPATDIARAAAHVIAGHPEQGWSLLCNGIVLFDDGQVASAPRFSRTPAGLPPPMADPVDVDDMLAGWTRLPAARPTVGDPAA